MTASREPANWKYLETAEKRNFWSSVDSIICDGNGVLWKGSVAVPGAAEALLSLTDQGKTVFLYTNHTGVGTKQLVDKCYKFEIPIHEKNIVAPSKLTALYLKYVDFRKKIYLLGVEEFAKDLEDAGFSCIGIGPDNFDPPVGNKFIHPEQLDISLDPEVGAVVVAGDFHFNYLKLLKAVTYLSKLDCAFISPSPELNYRVSAPGSGKRRYFPAGGCFTSMIANVAQRIPIVLGKPETIAVDLAFKSLGLCPKRTLMIGDNFTDVIFGNKAGMKTMLVLSGDVTNASCDWTEEKGIPNYYAASVADLNDSL